MSNIIEVDFGAVNDGLSYIIDGDNMLGCSIGDGIKDVSVVKRGGLFTVESDGGYYNRNELARFLWMAAYMLDSDQEFLRDDFVCFNKDSNND